MLSDNTIKRSALRYLKGYYKHRPRTGDTTARLDQRAEGGIIADGYLSFPNEEGRQFTATFEATSHLSKGEIVYQIQRTLLFVDAATLGLAGTALLFTLSHTYDWFTVDKYGTWPALGFLWLSTLALFLLYYLLFRGLQRYRYIYAVEQFKQYYADEQWIAFGEDVFPRPQSKYLDELRNQCIKYGFGLLKVKSDEECIALITPARHQMFSGNREFREFMSQSRLTAGLANRGGSLWQRLRNIFAKTSASLNSHDRFQRTYYNQLGISALALTAIIAIFYTEYQKAARVYVDEREFLELMDSLQVAGGEEPEAFEVDTPFLNDPFPIAELPAPSYPDRGREKEKEAPITPIPPPEATPVVEIDSAGLILNGNERILIPDCARLQNLEDTIYLLVEGNYPRMAAGEKRLRSLIDSFSEGGLVHMGCFVPERTDYALFAGLFYNERKAAEAQKKRIEQALLDANRSGVLLTVVQLNPPQ